SDAASHHPDASGVKRSSPCHRKSRRWWRRRRRSGQRTIVGPESFQAATKSMTNLPRPFPAGLFLPRETRGRMSRPPQWPAGSKSFGSGGGFGYAQHGRPARPHWPLPKLGRHGLCNFIYKRVERGMKQYVEIAAHLIRQLRARLERKAQLEGDLYRACEL